MEKDFIYDLVIIGAGPGGISLAAEARSAGIPKEKILILDKAAEHSWVIRYLYPDGKPVTANYKGIDAVCHGVMCIPDLTKEETLSFLDDAIDKMGVEVRYKQEVNKIEATGTLKAPLFQLHTPNGILKTKIAVVAIGIFGKPNKPSYKLPRKLRGKLHYDISKLQQSGNKVLVVGGGDTASEFAQFLKEYGNEVELSYRREAFNRMNDINFKSIMALEERKKVNILWKSNIEGVTISDDGNPVANFIEEEFGSREYDHIVFALGGTTPEYFLKTIGIEFSDNRPEVDESGESYAVPGMFVGGDLRAGKKGGSIISAFNSSRSTMETICDNYLDCKVANISFDDFPEEKEVEFTYLTPLDSQGSKMD